MSHLVDGECFDCRCDSLGYTCEEYDEGHPGCRVCWKDSGWYGDYLDSMVGDPDDYEAFWAWTLYLIFKRRNDPDS